MLIDMKISTINVRIDLYIIMYLIEEPPLIDEKYKICEVIYILKIFFSIKKLRE